MVTLDDVLDQVDERRAETRATLGTAAAYVKAGLWWVGWAGAKLLVVVLTVIAGTFYGVGRAAGACWPAICWCARAVRVGWEDARRRPDGPPR